jgi:hypothetical protein
MVESITAVVGIVGVVSVLSRSFLGSIPSMDVTCVSLSAQREISQNSCQKARSASRATHQKRAVDVFSGGSRTSQHGGCQTLTIFARCHDTVLLKLEPTQRMGVYLFRL